jgi:hypothetical protein
MLISLFTAPSVPNWLSNPERTDNRVNIEESELCFLDFFFCGKTKNKNV